MKGTQSHELDVALPASELWAVYGTSRLGELVEQLLPGVVAKLDFEQGDGSVGTVVRVTFPPGNPGPTYHKEKFVKIDDEQRLKETIVVEGGLLEFGFSSYLVRFEIIEKNGDSCTIKSTVEYEIDEEHAANAAYATTAPFAAIAEAVSKYLLEEEDEEEEEEEEEAKA